MRLEQKGSREGRQTVSRSRGDRRSRRRVEFIGARSRCLRNTFPHKQREGCCREGAQNGYKSELSQTEQTVNWG